MNFPNPSIPEIFQTPKFEDALADFKADVIAHVQKYDSATAEAVSKSFSVESQLSTKLVEACTYILLHKIRQDNDKVLNNFAPFARGENLDLVVSNLGLTRQVLQEGDPNAIPPIEPIMESDEALLLRYYLQPYAFKPGSAKGYEFSCLTLGEKPQISVDSSQKSRVVVTYDFDPDSDATRIVDAHAEQNAPGEVTIHVLGRDGVADTNLVNEVKSYIHRRDIKEATDLAHILPAAHQDYVIHVQVPTPTLSTPEFIREQCELALNDFASRNRKLSNTVRPEHVGGVLTGLSLTGYQVVQPAAPVATDFSKAPNCTSIIVEFI